MNPQHFDALGQPIQISDQVVLSKSGTTTLFRGVVTKLTPKKVTVTRNRGTWSEEVSKDPSTMVVVTKQHEYALETWPEHYI